MVVVGWTKTKLMLFSTQVEVVVELNWWGNSEKYYSGWPGGRAGGRLGEMEIKTISASNLKLKLELTESELGNLPLTIPPPWIWFVRFFTLPLLHKLLPFNLQTP